jgi:hypothetical protein
MTDDSVWFDAFMAAVENETLTGNQLRQYGVSVWFQRLTLPPSSGIDG